RDGSAPAIENLVEHDVVLESVRTNQVIVVWISIAPHQSRSLIHFAGDRLGPHGEFAILEVRLVENNQGKAAILRVSGRLRKHVRLARRGLDLSTLPTWARRRCASLPPSTQPEPSQAARSRS